METLTADDLAGGLGSLTLLQNGRAAEPWALVDLDHSPASPQTLDAAVRTARKSNQILIGVTTSPTSSAAMTLAPELAFSLAAAPVSHLPQHFVSVPNISVALQTCAESMDQNPTASLTFLGLLRLTSQLPVPAGLIAESLAYSMLLAGAEFDRWLTASRTSRKPPRPRPHDQVTLRRDGGHLFIELNHPERHNAFSHHLRDDLIEALGLAQLDNSIDTVHLSGAGPSFCSGGDIDEFGTADDVCVAHLVRQNQNAGAVLHRLHQQVRVVVHGACIGAGVELPAFADRIEARGDAYFQLPEVRMGLVPGAGGTVSITGRIGRWRTAYLGLSAQPVDVDTALTWGLVDARTDAIITSPSTASHFP